MDLPISTEQAKKAIAFIKKNFGPQIIAATAGTKFDIDTICGIACQETAYKWLGWIDKFNVETILQRCVFDASGDFPDTTRSAFPQNRKAFELKYGPDFTGMLIKEGNLQRAMPQPGQNGKGFQPANFLYKGYGIFQHDLQFVENDEAFFREKKWYSFDECLKRVMKELNGKYAIKKEMWSTLKAYNGAGAAANKYADNVTAFIEIAKTVA